MAIYYYFIRIAPVLAALAIECGAMCPSSKLSRHGAMSLPSGHPRILKSEWPVSGWEPQIPHAADRNDSLVRVNDYFHSLYDSANKDLRPAPLVLVEDDYLVEWNKDDGGGINRTVLGSYTPPLYHDLKMICHVPLAIVTTLLKSVTLTNVMDASTLKNLADYRSDLTQAMNNKVLRRFDALPLEARRNQAAIIDATVSFLDPLLKKYPNATGVPPSMDALKAFGANVLSLLQFNLDLAAKSQVDALHALFSSYKKTLDENERAMLRVGVGTSTMARRNNLVSQYFSRLYDVDIELNKRFFTFEEIWDEKSAFRIVGTHVSDTLAAEVFFDEPFRLQEDALADGAKKRLDELFGSSATAAGMTTLEVCFLVALVASLSLNVFFSVKVFKSKRTQRKFESDEALMVSLPSPTSN